ncbi:hypothetical protein SKAU_G00379810 [Synaphobranchus kaupii]|uniref:Uncharacterized protein n=1 Tax=Synaphobranchus kaupii TaxID=118154 RepID=A0A9Q1EDF4_SYNKA|nr:hypothetical protein SKAU_G00379810 [Synaphobranchus kaupii]
MLLIPRCDKERKGVIGSRSFFFYRFVVGVQVQVALGRPSMLVGSSRELQRPALHRSPFLSLCVSLQLRLLNGANARQQHNALHVKGGAVRGLWQHRRVKGSKSGNAEVSAIPPLF